MSSEDKEEVYVLEKAEISIDDDDGYNYEEIKNSDEEEAYLKQSEVTDSDGDLEDFEKLKAKAVQKKTKEQTLTGTMGKHTDKGKQMTEKPRVTKRDVVIDDYIRNYLAKFGMNKTLNIFQQEWIEQQKDGKFNDSNFGLIADIESKNEKMAQQIEKLKVDLEQERTKANKAKSTWEKIRKERDFHKTHQQRVQKEKLQITENIKKLKELQEQYEDKIKELNRKYETTVKEKTLLKLEKEKLNKRAQEIRDRMKKREDDVAQAIEKSKLRNAGGMKTKQILKIRGKNTPYPVDDARPNPFLSQEYEEFNAKVSNQKIIKAHDKSIGGMCLHFKKQILATVSDDCIWKIWNMEDGENILSGEGHKDWITGVDFHPAGSHLVTSGGDKTIKIWDFINS